LVLIEKEYDQLKHDYYNLTIKQKESVHTYSTLENENRNLLNSIEQIEHEKFQLKQIFENEKEKLLHEIKQLHEHQKREVISAHKQTDYDQMHLKQHIESLELRINNYENAISQYEEYRIKLEANLQKLTQQRDTNKVDLRLTQELLTNKDEEYNQLRLRVDEYEKHIQMNKERFVSYETTINDLQRQVQELNQTRSIITQVGSY
jgi:chromosome segregation ATPase